METKAKLPKKLLSMFLAVLMAFSCFSLVMPELVPQANAADATTVKNAITAAASKIANGGSEGSDAYTYTGDDGTVIKAAEEVFAYATSLRGSNPATTANNNATTSLLAKVASNAGFSSGTTGYTAIQRLINPKGTGVIAYENKAATSQITHYKREISSSCKYPSINADSITKTISISANLTNTLLAYKTLGDVPETIILGVDYAYTHAKDQMISHTDNNWAKYNCIGYKWNYLTGVSRTVTNSNTQAYKDLHAFDDYYFTSGLVNTSVQTLVGLGLDKIEAYISEYDTKTSAIKNTYGSTILDHFYEQDGSTTKGKLAAFRANCVTAKNIIDAMPAIDAFRSAMEDGYNAQDLAGMEKLKSDLAGHYQVLADCVPKNPDDFDALKYVQEHFTGYADFSFEAADAFYTQLKKDIELYKIREIKTSVDALRAQYPDAEAIAAIDKDADGNYINKNFNLITLNDKVKGYYTTLTDGTFTSAYIAEVFTDGIGYVETFKNEILWEVSFREIEIEYSGYYSWFIPLYYADLSKYANEVIYGADKPENVPNLPNAEAKRAEFVEMYNKYEPIVGTDTMKDVFLTKLENEAVARPFIDIIDAYIEKLCTYMQEKVEAQLDPLKPYVEDENFKISLDNFALVNTYVKAVDHDLYKAANDKGFVTKEYQAVYAKLDAFMVDYKDFVDKGGLDDFKKYDYDKDGIYTIRPAGAPDYPNDIARKEGEDYVVDIDAVNGTVDKLQSFLTSEDFCALLGLKNAETEEPYGTLSEAIEDILQTNLFTDNLVNTLVGSIFPMVGDMLGGMLSDLPSLNVDGIEKSPNADAAARLNLTTLANLSGYADLYIDGKEGSKKLVDVFEGLGLYIYPQSFAKKLPNDALHSKLINDLRAAGTDWTYFDRINPTIDGIEREGYNDEKVDALDFAMYEWEVTDYNSFVSAMGIVLDSLLPLLQTLLTGKDYSATVENLAYVKGADITIPDAVDLWLTKVDVTIYEVKARANATINIAGETVFKDLWIPVMEILGVTEGGYDLAGIGINGTYSFSNISASSTAADIANALFKPLLVLIEQLKYQPLNKVLDILPQLMYTLSFDMLQTMIDSVEINLSANFAINEIDEIKIIDIAGWEPDLAWLANLLKSTINGFLPKFDIPAIKLGELLNIATLIGCEYTNINTLLSFVLESLGVNATLPEFNAGRLISCATLTRDAASADGDGKRNKLTADRADVLYFLLEYIVSAIGNRTFMEGIIDLIANEAAEKTIDTDGDGVPDAPAPEDVKEIELPELVYQIINTVSNKPENALAALVELFNPQKYGTETIEWIKSQYTYNTADGETIPGMNAAALMYLDYSNDWTKEKATYLINNIDAIVSTVLEMTGQEVTEVNALIQDMFDELFSNINVTGLVKAVSSLGTLLGDADIVYTILEGVGADFRVLNDAFGYMFVTDLDRIGDGFVEPLKFGDKGYVNNFKFQVVEYEHEIQYKTDDEGEYVLDDNGEKITLYEQKLLVDADGKAILGADGKEQYVDIYVRVDEEGKLVECEATDEGARRIPQTKVVASWAYDYGDGNIKYINDESTDPTVIKETKTIFVDIICDILAGFSGLLGAFFRGDDVGVFNNAIQFLGYENYANTIGLFFELLGIPGAMTQEQYEAYCDAHGDTGALSYTIKQIFNWVDGYLLTGNTVQKLIEIIPNFIYFVETNGLSVLLHNLLMPVLVIVDTIRPIFDVNLNFIVSYILSEFISYGTLDADKLLDALGGTMPANYDPDYKWISVDLGKLTITEIIKIADAILGTNLYASQLGQYGLPGFCSGVVEAPSVTTYTENANGENIIYKSILDAPDAITILLSALLEAVQYPAIPAKTDDEGKVLTPAVSNGEVICDFIAEMMGEPEEGEEPMDIKAIYTAVIDLIQGVSVGYQVPNWGYMLGYEIDETKTTIVLPTHTINYLDYSTDWTENKAIAVEQTLDVVIKMVLESMVGEGATVASLLNGLFNDKVYTDANLTMMVEGIANLIGGLDEVLRNTIDVVIDADIASWFAMCDAYEEINDDGETVTKYKVKETKIWGVDAAETDEEKREMFVTGLYEVLMPAQRLISWFLFGEDFAFFTGTEKDKDGNFTHNDIITLSGGRAYDFALVPILEALGIEMPEAGTFNDSINGGYNVGLAIDAILTSVFDLVDEVSANPTKGVLDLLVNLLYFINADGLKTSVNNLLAPIDGLLAKVAPMIPDLNGATSIAGLLATMVPDLEGIDLSDLSMMNILDLLYEMAGIKMSEEMYGILCSFYIGELQQFTSANGNYAYRLAYTTDECYHDMLTIVLAFAVDLVKQNEEVFSELIGADIYGAIKALLTPYSVTYQDINWGYMYGNEEIADNTAALEKAGKFKPVEKFQYLKYSTDWTEASAREVYNQLNDVIAYVLGEFVGESSIAALLQGVLEENVYTEANLKTIVELIVNALSGLDRNLATTIGVLLDADLANTWFAFCEEQEVDGETKLVCTKTWGVDDAADKKTVFVNAILEILQPANRLLNWLFFGGTFTFFKDATGATLITLQGGNGYSEALVPIFEALGCTVQPAKAFYDEKTGLYDVGKAVAGLLDSALGLVDKISKNPAKEVMALIPNLLYFINADGLKASVSNLLAPVDALVGAFAPLFVEKEEAPEATEEETTTEEATTEEVSVVAEEETTVAEEAETETAPVTVGTLLESVVGFNINNLNTEAVLKLLVDNTGIYLNDDMLDVIKNIFALGSAEKFTSANGKTAYRVNVSGNKIGVFSSGEADVLTVLLSFAIDAFKLNRDLFAGLLPEGVYDAIIALIAGLNIKDEKINWAYMYSNNMEELERKGFPGRTITYLNYGTDWTEATADSVYAALANILDMVLPSILEENQSLKTLVMDLIEGNLYKTENLVTIVELIVNALAGFDASLRNVIGAVVDVNIAAWFDMCELDEEGKYVVKANEFDGTTREGFIAGLKKVLDPANELLSWLFFGTSYTFFNGTTSEVLITLNGGKGYAYGILPILEALGIEGLQKEYRDKNGELNVALAVEDILNKVLSLVETKLTSSKATVEFVFTLIPNLLYFINADGLKASVNNLVAPVNAVIEALSGVVGADSLAALLTDVIGIDISNLNTRTLLGLLEGEAVGFKMNAGMRGAIYNIYEVGTAQQYTSASGKVAYKVAPDMGDALTVILSFALDAFNLNEALFSGLLGEDVYAAVKKLIAGVEATISNIDWAYMYGTEAEKNNFYAAEEPKFPATKLQYLEYTTNWTDDTAAAVYEGLDKILDMVLPSLLGDNANLKELVTNLLEGSLYTDANLNAIVELIVNLLADFDEGLLNAVGALVAPSIGDWFTMCQEVDATDAEGNIILGEKVWVVAKDFGVDEADDKKAAFVNGLKEVLAPAENLLGWLFLGRDFTFFNGTTNEVLITIKGNNGYELGLVPIFEALGCEMKPAAETVGETVANLIDSVLGLLENLTNSADTVEFAFTLIPNLLYFINAGGLKASVNNLVAPVDAVIATLSGVIGEESLAALLTDVIGLDISNLTIDALLGILADEVGFEMNAAMEGTIRRIFAVGTPVKFTSANGKTAYKLDANGADTLTVLLSFALDAFNLNEALFADLLGEEIYTAVKTLIKGVNVVISEIDWGYMYEGETVADRTAALKKAGKFAPVADFQYLKYATNWKAETADKVYSALDDILVLVLPSLLGENENLKTLVEGILNKDVYTTENLEAIVELIVNALAGFDAELYNAVGALVDADISAWFNMCEPNAEGKYEVKPGTFNVTDKASFVDGLKRVLAPAESLLSWLFFGTSYTFFNGTTNNPLITLNGGKGYSYALVPILEALGVTGLKQAKEYKRADGSYNVGEAVADILDCTLALLDNLVAAESTVEFAFTLIPNLLYFINADGIKTSVNNLVAPVDAVIATLSDVVGADSLAALLADVLTDSIGIDIFNLNTDTLLALLETKLGFVMNDDMKQAIKDIYVVGEPAAYASASGKTAYKLNADKGDTLTVILSFALDAFNLNKALFADLLGEAQYDAVHDLILGASDGFAYTEIDWGYMFEGANLDAKLDAIAKAEGKLPNYPANSTAANYLLYGNNWNDETAAYVDMILDKMIAGFMSDTSLGQMLDNAVSKGLYQDKLLNDLISMVVELIVDYAGIIEGAGALLGAESIVDWFDYCEITKDADGKVISVEVTKDFGIDEAKTNDEKREKFVEAFVTVLKPAYRLLAWLLFDQEFTFFNGTTSEVLITLTGGRGYEEGLVPLLEALGCVMPEDYDAPIVMPGDPNYCYANGKTGIKPASAYVTTDADGNEVVNMEAAVRDVFTALTDWLYMICGDLAKQDTYGVVGTMLELLPNVIYNINAGTLKAVVSNLLVPVEEILGHLEAFGLEVDFSNLVKIGDKTLDLKNVDWYAVFNIVEETVSLYWPPEIQKFLATLYVGKAVEFTSANGKTAYFTTYNENDKGSHLISGREDMITLLVSFVVDGVLDERNAPRLKGWFGEDIYNVIMTYLTKSVEEVEMKDFDWILTKYANTGKVLSPITLGGVDALYGELYTREMGEYINTYLPSFIDTMIVLLGVESENGVNYEGLEDILNELIGDTLYTKANLQAILDAIAGLIPTVKDALGADLFDIIVNVLDKALNIDLTHFETYKIADFKDGDRDAFVTGLVEMLEPIYPILAWLLTDEDLIALFHTADGSDAVVIEGAEGYAYGIVPLLEAFDYDSKLILNPDEYKAASKNDPELLLRNILNPILNVVDQVLADPVNEIFNVLPALIYFINSNGLDAVIRNTLNAVVTVLHSIEPLTDGLTVEKIYEMIGFNGKIDIVSLLESLLRGIEEDTGFQFTEVAMNAITDLTVGKVVSFKTKNGFRFYDKPDYMSYTMEYAPDGDRVDMVTVVLRAVLTFISVPQNVKALEGMLEGQLDDEGYKFLCSLLENFSYMAAKDGGMDEIMYTVYEIFYAANVAAHSTEDWLAEFNGDYSFLNQLFATSDLAFLRQLESSLGDLLNKYTGDIVDDDEVVPNGFIAFFQKIADFFKKIGDFFKNLFK